MGEAEHLPWESSPSDCQKPNQTHTKKFVKESGLAAEDSKGALQMPLLSVNSVASTAGPAHLGQVAHGPGTCHGVRGCGA